MAQIVLKIKTNTGTNGKITDKTTNAIINNVSKPLTEPTTINNGVNGKSLALGYLSLTDGFLGGRNTSLQSEVHKYNGYMFGATDSSGKFDLEFELTGENIKSIIVRFDKTAKQYGITAILDNKTTVHNSSDVWNIVFPNASNTHTIKFTEWSRVNYNACIIGIDIITEYISYNQNHIESLDSTAQIVQSGRELSYGVIANTGDANLIDRNYMIKEFIEQGIISSSNLNIGLFVNGQQIQSHIVTDSDYDTIGQTFTIQFTNGVSQWDKITYTGRKLQYDENNNVISANAWELLVDVMRGLGYTENNLKSMCDDDVENTLKNITIPYPYLESDTYRATIDKICTLAQLNVYANELDTPVFVSARPLLDNADRGYVIPTAYQITQLKEDVILRNQYDGVDIEKYAPTVNMDQRVLVYTDKSNATDYLTNSKNQNVLSERHYTDSYDSGLAHVVQANIKSYYTDIYITIPKIQNNNLSVVSDLLTGTDASGNPNIKYNIEYVKNSGTASYYSNGNINDKPLVGEFTLKQESTNIGSGTIPTSYTSRDPKLVVPIYETTVTLDNLTNTTTAYFLEDSINYYVSLTILCGGIFIATHGEYDYTGPNIANKTLNGTYEEYIPQKVVISIYGTKTTIEFSKTNASTSNITSAKTVAKIQSNELMQTDKIVNTIKNNILSDYSNGIKTATIDIFCGNFENEAGDKLDFSQGDILKPQDIIALSDDLDKFGQQRLWRILSRTFKYNGQPTISLNLQAPKNFWHTLFDGEIEIVPEFKTDRTEYLRGIIPIPIIMNGASIVKVIGEAVFYRDGKYITHKLDGNIPLTDMEGDVLNGSLIGISYYSPVAFRWTANKYVVQGNENIYCSNIKIFKVLSLY